MRVTVLMAVYNGEEYIMETVESVLGQSYEDFEFLVIDDGSEDGSYELMRGVGDRRLRLVRKRENLGLGYCLNEGLEIAEGEYIARIDCDDLMARDRLEKQVEYLDGEEGTVVVGSYGKRIDGEGRVLGLMEYPSDLGSQLMEILTGQNIVAHPFVMYRKKPIQELGGYRSFLKYGQDIDLWRRIFLSGYHLSPYGVGIIGEYLTLYREHSRQVTVQRNEDQWGFDCWSFCDFMEGLLGVGKMEGGEGLVRDYQDFWLRKEKKLGGEELARILDIFYQLYGKVRGIYLKGGGNGFLGYELSRLAFKKILNGFEVNLNVGYFGNARLIWRELKRYGVGLWVGILMGVWVLMRRVWKLWNGLIWRVLRWR